MNLQAEGAEWEDSRSPPRLQGEAPEKQHPVLDGALDELDFGLI